jgi:hypothetical protein
MIADSYLGILEWVKGAIEILFMNQVIVIPERQKDLTTQYRL